MHYLRNDVVLEKVGEINLLISLRSAWGECPFALQIASISAYIWKSIKYGKEDSEIIEDLIGIRGLSRTKAENIFDNFIRTAERLHYLI